MTSYRLTEEGQRAVIENYNLVPFTIQRYFSLQDMQDDDLRSEGCVALCRAVATYDAKYGCTLSTYAITCIRRGIASYLHKQYHTCTVTDGTAISLNEPAWNDAEETEMIDLLADEKSDAENEAIGNIFYESTKHMVPTLTTLIESKMTMPELAKQEKCTKQNIHIRIRNECRQARRELELSGMNYA